MRAFIHTAAETQAGGAFGLRLAATNPALLCEHIQEPQLEAPPRSEPKHQSRAASVIKAGLYGPMSSFFFVSTDMTGSFDDRKACVMALMCWN